jgi:hypothetical protein
MPYLTANGTACVKGQLVLPRIGAWHADLVVDDTDPSNYEGSVELSIADGHVILSGTATRFDEQYGVVMLRVVAGGGGLGNLLPAKGYQNVPLSIPLGDICSDAGEGLSELCDAGTLTQTLPFWNRTYVTAGRALQALLAPTGVGWRMLFDGSLFVGPESWPQSPLTNYLILDQAPQEGRIEFSADIPNVRPGETLGGQPVSRLEHYFEADKLRSTCWFED